MPMITYGQSQNPSLASIQDVNGKTLLGLTPVASAVNYLTLANAATGNNPILAPVGSDTNIAFTLRGKGTGALRAEANLEFYDSGGTTRLGRFYKGAGGTMYAELSVVDFAGGTSWGSSSTLRINPFTPYLGGNSNFTFGWAAGTDATAALDTGLKRNAAGVIEINNGTAGTLRDLTLRNIISNASAGVKIGTAVSEKLGFFGATPVAQQTGGAATAGPVYGATEQGMLNAVYGMGRTMGLLS